MPAIGAIRAGRRWAESLMIDSCIVRRSVGDIGPMNPETGLRPAAAVQVVYGPDLSPFKGRCKVQTFEPHESKPESGQHVFTVQRYHLHVPIGAGPFQVDDRVEIVTSAEGPQLVGRTYRVSGLHHKSLATAQRLLIDEVTA
jgi:hypothetical protein